METTFYSEILKQLGGRRFLMMTGAKNLVYDNQDLSISMKIMRNAKKVTHVKIKLNSLDLYDLTFYNCGKELKIVSEINNIYCDQLQEIFEQHTGLYLTL